VANVRNCFKIPILHRCTVTKQVCLHDTAMLQQEQNTRKKAGKPWWAYRYRHYANDQHGENQFKLLRVKYTSPLFNATRHQFLSLSIPASRKLIATAQHYQLLLHACACTPTAYKAVKFRLIPAVIMPWKIWTIYARAPPNNKEISGRNFPHLIINNSCNW
jgi:hypothetical protein